MIKVCGMREPENIKALSNLPINLIGGIFYSKSPRFIGDRYDTAEAFAQLPDSIAPVGVFVNEELPYLKRIKEEFHLHYLQLHGKESPEFCKEARKIAPVIKAFGLHDDFDFSILKQYEGIVEMFVFDTSCKEHGGSGRKFNWDILSSYSGKTKFLLSGGIGINDVEAVCAVSHPSLAGVDLNSAFETSPGLKDISLLQQFVHSFC